MKQVRDLFEQREHGGRRVADRRQHLGVAASADPRGLGGNGVAPVDVRKQRAFGEKLARTPGMNRRPILRRRDAEPCGAARARSGTRCGRLALSEQPLAAGELTHLSAPKQSLQALVIEIGHHPFGKLSVRPCASLRPCT
jgi:hypothetical protein